ncbi:MULTISPECIES: undecaprenyl-diphosphate phosphatase [Leptolyngbya]|jgi:undecaprenyl-diphosphatase|uniref:Undecaprenyl-diphosphatase n=1 Tax=Leptolyngbya boryana NIES-2135 TaxID=1973484 RepID=A0A1Z4JEP8_LEPBY|nr:MULTISPECIES: undecaprenyl-diphosphate phosphatase [Leptolyngbya]BAY55148.1 undecaprenyl-diphosphatase [Leptolyngbya boryana NIES-2135]MBD2369237.1 undecaprenyl-diphosphate phosphatase [Leptolyngbya sp. FACHB-161]MBD2375761.1 undecaprenyl-diphosphate phosphatase [Leptolyngbya sp. FACHB-238]MBD2401110.1 undecaprenyl-diphosphate phosphatase [Leptolyngbya sp. FACHB-239]MBD2406695.1 undecaprenyl-diphosphate phosphatase [Leptolyngbya sp. FACHB-402]
MTPLLVVASESNSLFALFQGVVLGLVQGITEFLPISSTAHLIIFTDVFGWQNQWKKEAIDAIQFGSVIAVLMYFWKDIRNILSGALGAFVRKEWYREDWKIFIGIVFGTVPALAGGLMLKELGVKLESATLIAVMSIVMSLLLALAEKVGSRKRGFDELEVKDGILVGLGQMIALLPGASRSGSTLTTGLFLGLRRETAARFSFLLGLPTLAIATLVQTKDVLQDGSMGMPLLFGIISAFVFSYLSIAWLLKFLQRQSTWVFVWYRLALGITLLAAIATQVLKA